MQAEFSTPALCSFPLLFYEISYTIVKKLLQVLLKTTVYSVALLSILELRHNLDTVLFF